MKLTAPFPWFGGKSRVTEQVWARFGDVRNYVEPFCGSAAMLLGRPLGWRGVETINDLDGFVSNFWRSMATQPEEVARWADWPVNECDLHSRHAWLIEQRGDLAERLMGDPEWCDPKVAGWWVWGLCSWIGTGWCSGSGPWIRDAGRLVLRNAGQGINRQLPHLGNAGRGINRQLPHLGDAGRGHWLLKLASRLARIRVTCGDWSRVVGPSVTEKHGLTAIFLDPDYCEGEADYATSAGTFADVRDWAFSNGRNPQLRIALCGYDNDQATPSDWACLAWKAQGGYGSQGTGQARLNACRELIWFSPHCLRLEQLDLFRETA